jgi:hypothetical protein
MYFATGKRNGKSEGGLSLDAVVAECAQVIQNSAITVAGIRRYTSHQRYSKDGKYEEAVTLAHRIICA